MLAPWILLLLLMSSRLSLRLPIPSAATALCCPAGAMAVSQPQSCKPGCVGDAARAHLASMPPSGDPQGRAAAVIAALERFLAPKLAQAAELLAGKKSSASS
jgi:hypothetical protein